MSLLIPKDEMTLTDMKNLLQKDVSDALIRAVNLKIAPSADQLSIRPFENILDAATGIEQWNTQPLLVVGNPYSVFGAAALIVTLAANKLCVFYKVGVETTPLPVSLLQFRKGGAAGNLAAEFDLEQIVNSLTSEGYFQQPVIFGPTETFAVNVIARIATGVLARVQLGGFIVEPAGARIA